MDKKEAKNRIEKLKEVINYHRYLYHVLDVQEISDDALDSLKHELARLEKKFPILITPDSPTQRVGGEPLEGFEKVSHKTPMLSIEDVFSQKELLEWEDYIKRFISSEGIEYFAEPKVDGLAVSLIYKDGIFSRGATRGNGRVGEDVTQNLKTIESVPLQIKLYEVKGSLLSVPDKIAVKIEKLTKDGEIEVRGEVYMERKDFNRFNKKTERQGGQTFANPRNLAAGSIRQLDPMLASTRPLKFFAYDIVNDFGQEKHSEEHQALSLLGFKTDAGKVCSSLEQVNEYYGNIKDKRDSFPFQIDGVVVGVNDNSLFQKLGAVGKSPRGVRAFKFPPKQATTKIRDIQLQVGRTGAVTPVAILEPVRIDGVTISRATLHNEDEINRLDIRKGDTVVLGRAGDVIPIVFKVLDNLRTGKEKKFKMPKDCPSCGKTLVKPGGEAIWRCIDPNCYSRRKKNLAHFVSQSAFDIEGLGLKIIEKLIEKRLVSEPADFFNLRKEDLVVLEGFAEKASENLILAIKEKKAISFPRFIYALGIRNVGEETSFILAEKSGSLEKLRKASLWDLEKIRDIGPVVAQSIYQFFKKKSNSRIIENLKKAGVKINKAAGGPQQKLVGSNFVITGNLDSFTRQEAKNKIRSLGGDVSDSVSQKTDFLIKGSNPGSKLQKAEALRVKIIDEKEFLSMIE